MTACTAVHWFDIPKFYEEARRVLAPWGVLAIINYDKYAAHKSEVHFQRLNELMEKVSQVQRIFLQALIE